MHYAPLKHTAGHDLQFSVVAGCSVCWRAIWPGISALCLALPQHPLPLPLPALLCLPACAGEHWICCRAHAFAFASSGVHTPLHSRSSPSILEPALPARVFPWCVWGAERTTLIWAPARCLYRCPPFRPRFTSPSLSLSLCPSPSPSAPLLLSLLSLNVLCRGDTYRQRFRGRACLFSQASQSSHYSSLSTLSEARVKVAIRLRRHDPC
jgi:hypothetical protein